MVCFVLAVQKADSHCLPVTFIMSLSLSSIHLFNSSLWLIVILVVVHNLFHSFVLDSVFPFDRTYSFIIGQLQKLVCYQKKLQRVKDED